VTDARLIPAALYGLRTWRPAVDAGGDCLIGAYDATPWPDGGAWLHAGCRAGAGHRPPEPSCSCGVHAWHPTRRSARAVLASRTDIVGIVESAGAIEVHEEGFRAQRARPYALVVLPGRNARLVARLAERYGAELIEVTGPDALLAWCDRRGLGLGESVVGDLLGTDRAAVRRGARRRRRRDLLRLAAAAGLAAALVGVGLAFVNGPPSPNGVYGRTGWVVPPRTTACPPDAPDGGAPAPARGPSPPAPGRC
jgi:hypothetical protein